MEWINIKDELPNNKEIVLCYFEKAPWISKDIRYKLRMAEFRKGMTLEERENLLTGLVEDTDVVYRNTIDGIYTTKRSRVWSAEDEQDNNPHGYIWNIHGNTYLAAYVTMWCRVDVSGLLPEPDTYV